MISIIDKYRKMPLFIKALFLNLIILFFDILFGNIKYEVSDDFVVETVLSGAYSGVPNSYMLFSNFLLGYALKIFYLLFPGISWYMLFHLVAICISFSLITYIIVCKNDSKLGWIIAAIISIICSNDAYILVQFTKTATILSICGSLAFLHAVLETKSILEEITGAILVLLGSMLRFQAIKMVAGFVIIIIIYKIITIIKNNNMTLKSFLNEYARALISGVLLIILVFGLYEVNSIRRYSLPEERHFAKYGMARSLIVDSVDNGYEYYKDELIKIGISETDYNMLKSWCLYDTEYFDIEKLEKVAEIITEKNKEKPLGKKQILQNIFDRDYNSYPLFWLFLILFLYGIFYSFKTSILSLSIGGLFSVYILYLAYISRMVYRVEYGLFLCAILSLCFLFDVGGIHSYKLSRKAMMFFGALCIALQGQFAIKDLCPGYDSLKYYRYLKNTMLDSWDYDIAKYRTNVIDGYCCTKLLKYIEDDKKNFYLVDFKTGIQTIYFHYSPYKSLAPAYYESNYMYLGGVLDGNPEAIACMKASGIENPIKQLIDEHVLLVDNTGVETKLEYLREHYYPNAWAENVGCIDSFNIWKIHKE